MNAHTRTLTMVCHVRAPLLLEPVDSQVESLRACEDEGTIDELLVRSWPKEVSFSEESPYQEVIETHDRLQRWADGRDVSISPPFRTRTRTSQITDETEEVLATPLLCLECYLGDELVGVYPHSTGEETITTEDVIARVRCGDDAASAAEELAELTPDRIAVPEPAEANPTAATDDGTTGDTATGPAAESPGCPDCDGTLVDGQGLVVCTDCEWTGTMVENGGYDPVSLESPADGELARSLRSR